MPYTKPIRTAKALSHVRIHVSRKFVGIDAVQITSSINNKQCKKCHQYQSKFRIHRKPFFENNEVPAVDGYRFEDRYVNCFWVNEIYLSILSNLTNYYHPNFLYLSLCFWIPHWILVHFLFIKILILDETFR